MTLLKLNTRSRSNYAVTQHPRPVDFKGTGIMGYSLRTDRYRYTEWLNLQTGAIEARELYDDANDPGETVNHAAEKDFTDELHRHQQLLSAEFKRHPRPWQRHATSAAQHNPQTNTISP
jgi:iduronate 2-sulfatase